MREELQSFFISAGLEILPNTGTNANKSFEFGYQIPKIICQISEYGNLNLKMGINL